MDTWQISTQVKQYLHCQNCPQSMYVITMYVCTDKSVCALVWQFGAWHGCLPSIKESHSTDCSHWRSGLLAQCSRRVCDVLNRLMVRKPDNYLCKCWLCIMQLTPRRKSCRREESHLSAPRQIQRHIYRYNTGTQEKITAGPLNTVHLK